MESDPIIEEAKRDLANLEAQCRELETFIHRYERYKAAVVGPQLKPRELESHRSPSVDTVMSAVHDILTKQKDALTLTAIFDLLVERGVVVGGNNPKQNLSQKLSASPKLKSYGKRGWYFADTIPPCLKQDTRLSEHEWDNEEDLGTEVTRPLQSNGAAELHSA